MEGSKSGSTASAIGGGWTPSEPVKNNFFEKGKWTNEKGKEGRGRDELLRTI